MAKRKMGRGKRLAFLVAGLLVGGVAAGSLRYVWPATTSKELETGLTLQEIRKNRLEGAVRLLVVRATRADGWKPRVVPAGPLAKDKAAVSEIAAATGAPVAVNGSFFFYDGPAVGPLCVAGEWWCLPWANRTSLGIKEDGSVEIGAMTARIVLTAGQDGRAPVSPDGTATDGTPTDGAASAPAPGAPPGTANGPGQAGALPSVRRWEIQRLNGNPQDETWKDDLTMLTARMGDAYRLRSGETALAVRDGKVLAVTRVGQVALAGHDYVVVANGKARPQLDGVEVGQSVAAEVVTVPAQWQTFPEIVGGGPQLVHQGQPHSTEANENFRPDVLARGPRTALGRDAEGNLLLVVAQGGSAPFWGLTLPEMAQEMAALGATEAINLDGGHSTAMVVQGQLQNEPEGVMEVPVSNVLILAR